jgi:hypothetical protein
MYKQSIAYIIFVSETHDLKEYKINIKPKKPEEIEL